MAIKYTYPRVTVSATANQHSSVQPPVPDTTVMFIPIVTKKGPNSIITPVHSLSEFISIFGDLDYATNGQMALNLYNWLRNGGTAYVYRLAGEKFGQVKAVLKTAGSASEWKSTPTVVKDENGNDIVVTEWSLMDLDDTEMYKNKYLIDTNGSSVIYKDPEGVIKTIYTKKSVENLDLSAKADESYYFIANAVKDTSATTLDGDPKPYLDNVDGKTDKKKLYYKNCLFVVNKDAAYGTAKILRYTEKNDSNAAVPTYGHAKYYGKHYMNYEVEIEVTQKPDPAKNKKLIFTINVYEKASNAKLKVESFPRRTVDNYKNAVLSSEYIDKDFNIHSLLETITDSEILIFSDADDKNLDTDLKCLPIFWREEAGDVLGNPSETPIDIIFDAGYPLSIKNAMMAFINNTTGQRKDIVGIFDTYELGIDPLTGKTGYLAEPVDMSVSLEDVSVATNIAVYAQYFLISDEIHTSQQIYVTPTYFLSKLIAYNDINYGIQFPTAGIRRGVLDDAEGIYYNPTADAKQDYFTNRINYVEKTPREYAFMNQRTHDNSSEESYTALSFLNNIRVVEKMKKELERLGRNYLFEFNDAITLSNLSNVLNNYVMNWIANRTLATGVVTVAKNPWSDEAVDVTLTIRFNGTIEVISVEITIE